MTFCNNRAWVKLFLVSCIGGFSFCSKEEGDRYQSGRPDAKVWAIPKEAVVDAGVGKDGIPSIDNPQFSPPEDIISAFDDQLVLGFEHNGEYRAYPVQILDWHEIVNDEIDGLPVAITYCPLTGTGLGWSRLVGGSVSTFGVSGLLYNSNLMPYDRRTNSTWSQQAIECVNGFFIGEQPKTYNVIETTFRTWKASFPHTKIMNGNTGFNRVYSVYPYGDYRTNDDLIFFPLTNEDDRLPAKEKVLGVLIREQVKGYPFPSGDGRELLIDTIDQKPLLIIRSRSEMILTAFNAREGIEYQSLSDSPLPDLFRDNQGNIYDLSGRVIRGPDQNARLSKPLAFMGFWFSWAAFYPEISLYDDE